jgi:hypothetical protein
MTAKTKFLNSILTSAQNHDGAMPWTRGPARRASIARRRAVSQSTAEATSAATQHA